MIKNISDLKRDDMFFLLAGPCVIEGEDMALRIAERVVKLQTNCIFHTFLKVLTGKQTVHVWILSLE